MSQIDDRGSGDVALSWAEQERTLPWTRDTRRYVERLEESDGERIDTRRDTDTERERDRQRQRPCPMRESGTGASNEHVPADCW
jgi:hypothetical protein